MRRERTDQAAWVHRFIEAAGHLTRSFGLGRTLGQVYACLYFSPTPRTLDDLREILGISKGSASMVVRQLERWGAVRKVWVKGDRKDYYRARDAFGRILKNAVRDLAGRRMARSAERLHALTAALKQSRAAAKCESREEAFVRERIQRLCAFQDKVQKLWDDVFLKTVLR